VTGFSTLTYHPDSKSVPLKGRP